MDRPASATENAYVPAPRSSSNAIRPANNVAPIGTENRRIDAFGE